MSSQAQCEATATASTYEITCGESVELTAFGQSSGTVVLSEDFNSGGFGSGWGSTPGSTSFSNPCSPSGVDGTPHAWMDNNTSVPRTLESATYDLTAATAGVTICFDLLFAEQGGNSPCEGPDEPDEGVYLQYSTDGGATWIDIHYFDPNGGNDPQLTNWNNWCFQIPAAAITANTTFRWHQTADSGADYDHWGIDNVEIYQNDINSELVWQHDGYSYGVGNPGGANPNLVTPTSTTTYTVELTTGSGTTCTDNVTIVVNPPVYDVNLSVNPSTPLCPGDCADITGNAQVVLDPGGIETYENNEFTPVLTGSASVNINIQDLNMTTINPGSIQEICINSFNFTGTEVCPTPVFLGGCDCNGTTIGLGDQCNLDVSSFEITLTSPSGCTITLVPSGGITSGGIQNMCFVPSGGTAISSGSGNYSGQFDPNDPISNLDGCDANGLWTLEFDAGGGLGFGAGALTGWSITFDDPPITQPVNATWTPGTSLSSTNTVNTQACPNSTTDYTLTLDNGTPGCPTFDTIIPIVVNPCGGCTPPNINIDNLDACTPNSVDLNNAIGAGSDPSNVSFYNTQVDADNGSSNTISANVSSSGSYWIRAEDPNDPTCFLSYEVIVTINPTDDPTFSLTDFCDGNANTATITGTTGGTFAFNPAPGDGSSVDAGSGEVSNGVPGTTYTIEYTTSGTCPSSSTQTVTVLENPTFNLSSNDPSNCGASDGSIEISGLDPNSTYSITYDDDGVTAGPNNENSDGSGVITISNLDAGDYNNFIIENSNGCSTTDNTLLTLVEPSAPTVGAGTDQTICDGDAITLTANNPDNASISWDNGISDGVSFSPSTTTIYTVTADLNGCTATDQVEITVNSSFTFGVTTNDPTVCGASDGYIVLTGLTANTSYDVSYDNGGSTVGPISLTSDASGEITVGSLAAGGYNNIVITPASGCSASDNTGWSLTDPNAPTIGAGNDQTICDGDDVTLTANNPDGASISWDNGVTDGILFNPNATTTYTVTADLAGCTSSDQVIVTVNPLPNPVISNVNDLCVNDAPIVLNSNLTGGNYSGNGVSGNQFDPNTAGVGTHTITYSYTDINGCSNDATTDIDVINTPSFSVAGTDPSSCNTNDGEITISNLSPNTSYDLTYTDNGNIVGPTNITTDANGEYIINGLPAGSYSDYSIALASGCSANDNSVINLTAPNSPVVDAGSDVTICAGEQVTLTATNPGAAPIVWNNGVNDGVAFTPNQTSTYTVTADPNGCPASDQVTVTVNPLPNVVANATATSICQGDQVSLFGSGAQSYQWDQSVSNNTPFSPSTNTTYNVTGTDANGCQNSDQIAIVVNPNPTPNINSDINEGCTPLEVNFSTNSTGNATWDFGDGNTSIGNFTPSHVYNTVGCFDVSLTITENGCSSTVTQNDFICTSRPPIADFAVSSNIVQSSNPAIQFTNNSIGEDSLKWHFGDGNLSNETNPLHIYSEEVNQYNIMLVAFSESNCSDTTYNVVGVEEDLLFYVPNTFTPDGDPHNQVFKPIMTSGFDPQNYTLYIFNRWGEPLFESHNTDIGWDGTYQGSLVQDGTYVWKIIIHDARDDERKEFTGHINVLK